MDKNHDYIRRILAKAQFTGNFQDEYPTAQIHALIDTVPAENVQPVVHGKWIDKKKKTYGMQTFCSACGKHSGIGGIESNRHKPYCPNCGARMDLEDQE